MLLNLTNHPFSKWSEKQRGAAEGFYGSVVDIPFPAIEQTATLDQVNKIVQDYVQLCHTHLDRCYEDEEANAIHIMGEYTFTYQFVKEMEKRNILCVASTTERIVTDTPDGSKTTVFQFVQFDRTSRRGNEHRRL
jgi:hypothetical protein